MNKTIFRRSLSIIFLSLLVLSLGGCFNFGGSTTKSEDARNQTYENSEISIQIPKEWETIEKKDFTSDVPAVTLVVFRNNVKNETFTANVNIVSNPLQETVDSVEYAKLVYNRQKNGLYDFQELKREDLKIKIGGKDTATTYLVFTAKKATDQPDVKYLQVYAVKNNLAYIVTGAVSPKENDVTVQTIESIVKSFQLK